MTAQTNTPVRKYRPSLTLAEIRDCITALDASLPHSTALIQLQLYEARLRIREPEAMPQGRQTNTLAESAVPKVQLPADVQADYDKLYANGMMAVFSGSITEAELDAEVRKTLTQQYPEHAKLINPQ